MTTQYDDSAIPDGHGLYAARVKPLLRPEDDGKYVVMDMETADFEIDVDDYTAGARLRKRHPNGIFWIERAGYKAAYKMGMRSTFISFQPLDTNP